MKSGLGQMSLRSGGLSLSQRMKSFGLGQLIQRVPALRRFWDLKKTSLHEIYISGSVIDHLIKLKSPTCAYISQKLQ